MKVATRDRGDIIHFAGFHGLSPALRDGVPAFVMGHDASATRCGWETFFRAMGDRGLAAVLDENDPAASELRPEADTRDVPRPHAAREGSLEHARRFCRALFPRSQGAGGKPAA